MSTERGKSALDRAEAEITRTTDELDVTYASLRSVICGGAGKVPRGVKVALIGLLPEVQDFEPEVKRQMRDKGLGHLVERQEAMVRENHARLMGES